MVKGQIFTPSFLVKEMLDIASYQGREILQKHVMDNSCGDGAFLCEAVRRYCFQYQALHGGNSGLKEGLEKFIHGIEIDKEIFNNCIYNLDAAVLDYGVDNVNWDVLNENALDVHKYDGQMDYVVGNPPYVRVHDLKEDYSNVKSFSFARNGMTDLYLVFFELSFRMLCEKGKLCYITPNSWLSSNAAAHMRDYISERRNLECIIDFGDYQMFDTVSTHVIVSFFNKVKENEYIAYYIYENKCVKFYCNLPYDKAFIGGKLYLGNEVELEFLHKVMDRAGKSLCKVKNGIATLADKVFIQGVNFSKLTIPMLKASTGQWKRAFFPYNAKGKPLSHEEIFLHPEIALYLNSRKHLLLKGRKEEDCPGWYLYGHSQALKDVFSDKYAINNLIRGVESIKIERVPAGSGVYSGFYILTELPFEKVENALKCGYFIDYLKILKKYKNGGYYTFNSRELEMYLNLFVV